MRLVKPFSALLLLLWALATGVTCAETITWWHWQPSRVIEKYQPWIDRFQQDTGVQVELRHIDWADMQETLLSALASGTAPDVVEVSSRWGDTAAMQGAFEDLTSRVQADPTFQDFFPASMDLWTTWDGKVYGIPGDLDVPALFYNKGMFDDAGIRYPVDVDWDQWFAISRKLTTDVNGDGQFDRYGVTDWWYVWITMVWANGGRIIAEDRSDIALDSPKTRQTLRYWKGYVDQKLFPDTHDAQRLGAAHPAALWKNGRIAMAPAGAWMPDYWVYDDMTGGYVFDFDVTHLPKSFSGGRATPIEGSAVAMVRGSRHQEVAWKFIQHMRSAEFMRTYDQTSFPSRISVAGQAFTRPDAVPKNKAVLLEVTDYARPFPKGVRWWEDVYGKVTAELRAYLNGRRSLDGALENLSALVRPVLHDAQTMQQ